MELTNLEILGFKSFANKTELEFGRGITAIIGPNGCGKSNVTEAIRWVLGEQNPRNMRCEKMEDIIFMGTKDKPATGMSEVSITFTNNKGILPVEYSEVTLTRRLFRTGESEYMLNRNVCRLKDIVDLFLDTGMGIHAYSLLERSQVDSILSDRTEDRRSLFDEAAGISKYKQRRKSTLKKLAATETDLLRLDDIVAEVEKTVTSLKRQVKRAESYQKYVQDLIDTETAVTYLKYHDLLNREKPLQEEMAGFIDRREEFTAGIESQEAQIEKLRAAMIDQEKKVVQAAQILNEISEKTKALDDEFLVNRERQKALEQQSTRSREDIENYRKRRVRLEEEMVQLKQEIETTQSEIGDLEAAYQTIKKERDAAQEKTREHEKEINLFEQQTRSILQQRLSVENELKNVRQRAAEIEHQLQQAQDQFDRMTLELDEKDNERDELTTKLDRLKEAIDRLQETVTQRQTTIEKLMAERQEIITAEQADRERLASVESNLKVLEELRDRYEGFQKGVRSLMTNRERLSGIRGVLSEFITVEPDYESAIEAVLGERVQLVITDNHVTSLHAIDQLAQMNGGRASFYPINPAEEHPESTSPANNGAIFREEGVRGLALSMVSSKVGFSELTQLLLADTIIVEDLITAVELQNRYPAYHFVTQRGETLTKSGILSGGDAGKGQDSSLLARQRQIESLAKERVELKNRLADYQQKRAVLESTIEDQSAEQAADREELKNRQQQYQTLDRKMQALTYQLDTLKQRQTEAEDRIDRLTADREQKVLAIEQTQAEFQEIAGQSEQAEQQLQQRREDLKILRQEAGQLANRLNTAQINLISTQGKLDKWQSDLNRHQESRSDIDQAVSRLENDIAAAQATLKSLQIRAEELESLLESQHRQETEHRTRVEDERDQLNELTTQAQELEKIVKNLRTDREKLQETFHEIELKLAHWQQERENVIFRLNDEHQIDITTFTEMPPLAAQWTAKGLIDFDHWEGEIHDLRQRIRNLGPVNLLAFDEYKQESDRFEFLSSQKKDLEEARASLRKVLTQINKKARELFQKTFEEVRIQFINMFVTLFEGGEADLILNKNVDLLEADIQILARPRGKKLQNINLLSAGERALTAIALLFAIYFVKPSPFCILDEIDAPLDDANIGRFTRILRQLNQNSQFVMITHNKRTMEIADRLYGVTMEEPGVSRLVSVKFEE